MTGLVTGLIFAGAFMAGAGHPDGKRSVAGLVLIAIGLLLAYLMDVRLL